MRERDLAQQLQISEADLMAAYCGINVVRISPRIETFLTEDRIAWRSDGAHPQRKRRT